MATKAESRKKSSNKDPVEGGEGRGVINGGRDTTAARTHRPAEFFDDDETLIETPGSEELADLDEDGDAPSDRRRDPLRKRI